MKMIQIQQGDVVLRRLQEMPKGKHNVVARKRCTLAHGEHTGHHHTLENDDAELIAIGETLVLKLGASATLEHQEHLPVTVEPGIWEVGRVQEYDYFSKMSRPVQD